MARIYLTYCSREKAERYRGTGESVTPDQLYTSDRIQRFICQCKARGVTWAIFSDLYAVWFPEAKHPWYDKDPGDVTCAEFEALLQDFDESLSPYSEIYFCHNAQKQIHPLYVRLLGRSKLAARIKKMTDWERISPCTQLPTLPQT
jgi:hypothetical protein